MSTNNTKIMGNRDESDYHNPNAEDYVLQPGEKRVRFSICDSTFHFPNVNQAYEEDDQDPEDSMEDNKSSEEPSKFQQVRSRRRDSVFPIYQNNDKSIILETASDISTNKPELDNEDPFAITDFEEEPTTPWSDLSKKEKITTVGIGIGKTIALLGLLYFFVCSLDLLSKGFRLIGGRTAGEIFTEAEILQNPVVGVMIGILTTVLVQSSSTSTSIIVGMVSANFMEVKMAIPLIMGSNIGTSITNTIVSFMQAGDKAQFRRAFAGATVLDMFNWITVIVLLIVEVLTDYLYWVSKATVDLLVPDPESGGEIKLLSVLTEPFVNLIVQLDESVFDCWSDKNCTAEADASNTTLSLIKDHCKTTTAKIEVVERLLDIRGKLISSKPYYTVQETDHKCSGEFIFAGTSLSDAWVGVIVLFGSLFVLCMCLILIVKVLSSVLRGQMSVIIRKTLNADIPYVPWITGYIAIIIGAILTFLVQSSSVFTSALTPLVGLGVISLERVYPLTLGSNIGTTTTALIASFAVEPKAFADSMQIALCHFYFNLTGIILFYPIPFTRFPVPMAKFLGNTTANYRWFAIVYMVLMFAIVPAIFIGLSFAGPAYVIALVSIVGTFLVVILIISVLQKKFPSLLPEFMRSWKWLPAPLRSLQPYDEVFSKLMCCAKFIPDNNNKRKSTEEQDVEDDRDNFIYYVGSPTLPYTSSINNSTNPTEDDNNANNNSRSNNDSINSSSHNSSNGHINSSVEEAANANSSNNRGTENNNLLGSDNEGYRDSTESVMIV